jgi:HEAT repeat protein
MSNRVPSHRAIGRILTTLAVILFTGMTAHGALPTASRPCDDPLKEVRRLRDKVDPGVFASIGRQEGDGGFKDLRRAVRELRSEDMLDQAYEAFSLFMYDSTLEPEALSYLFGEALSHPRYENRRSAARALAGIGDRAQDQLMELLRRRPKGGICPIAASSLVEKLGDEGTLRAAEDIIAYAPIRTRKERDRASSALRKCAAEGVAESVAKEILDDSVEANRRLFLLSEFRWNPPRRPHKVLIRALGSSSPEVRAAVLDILGHTGLSGLSSRIRSCLKSKHEPEVRAAVIALGRLARFDKSCYRELSNLIRSKDGSVRRHLPIALAQAGTDKALAVLHEMLADTDRFVRSDALHQLSLLRRKESIPVLIARIDNEESRLLQEEVTATLRILTGKDHGRLEKSWHWWWSVEGQDFLLPSLDTALAAERERRKHRAESETQSFYGMRITSDRVAFVIDTSGSMSAPARFLGQSQAAGSSGPTRLDVAKHELSRALKGLLSGDQFNVVFFSGGVDSWKPNLVSKTPMVLRSVLQHIGQQAAAGGTNIHDALLEALSDPEVDTVYLLSDGDPTAGTFTEAQEILRSIRGANAGKNAHIHCISIGKESGLMRELARQNRGQYKRVG